MKQQYTISIFSEQHIGLLSRITIIFTRRHISIESITASETEVHGIYRYTIVITEEKALIKKLVKQIEKQIDVFAAYYHRTEDVVHQELAMYKLPIEAISQGMKLENIMRRHHARIISLEEDFLIIEKTGHKEDTQKLYEELEPFGIMEFVRSGRVAIIKSMWRFSDGLHAIDQNQETILAE